ncbi:hypothetical protein [Novosphingobium malaysiense]|uniref:Spore coat protein U domain-containing protein n=1 Tax=Novosphingobium malaysiense TaxID=1348853 RepID=A0A0B1ZWM1_9SPHN|nr:hypothetical protein [Novosphingobium malaysiense]KHK93552.1 hypothetical protein LK12_04720 [Novosphingobium malaysiense]
MRKLALLALAASTAVATPALADVTGTVDITGSVADKCVVLPGSGSTFGTTVALGELAQADGTMRTDLASSFSTIGGSALSTRVVCTTPNPTIAITATPLATAAPAATGYDNSIDYQADVHVVTVGGSADFSSDSAGGAFAATTIGDRLANNGGDNITISASNFRTNNATDLLVASPTYTGQIVVVIAPGA